MLKKLSALLKGDGFSSRATRGSIITTVGFAVQNLLRLGSPLILTRLLFPEAFGLMALVMMLLAAIALFTDFGFRGAIVASERGDEPIYLNTAFTIQILRGIALTTVVLLIAKPFAEFYEEPELVGLLMIAGFVPFIQGFLSTRMATASRELLLGRLTIITIASQACGYATSILLAWWFETVWSIAVGALAQSASLVIMSHTVLPGVRNRLAIEWASVKGLFNFGKYIFLATISYFFIAQGDKAVLGKYIPLDEFAYYNIGVSLAMVPWLFANGLNDAVVFPLFARKPPSEDEENRRRFNKARFGLTGFVATGTAVLALIGIPLVEFLYDPRYHSAGPILSLVALAAMPRLITQTYEKLPLAAGHTGRYAFLMVTASIAQFGLMILAVQTYGLIGAICAPLLGWALVYPMFVYFSRMYKGWSPLHDGFFAVFSLCVTALTFWLWQDQLLPFFDVF